MFKQILNKKNFQYLALKEEIDLNERFDYLFYFPDDNRSCSDEIGNLIRLPFVKSLICVSEGFTKFEEIRQLTKEANLNVKIVYFDLVFGPRLKENRCGHWFSSVLKDKKIVFNGQPDEKINILPARDLVRELIKLIFSFDSQFKEYYLLPKEEINYYTFSTVIKNLLPNVNVEFLKDGKKECQEPTGAEKIKLGFISNRNKKKCEIN